MYPDPSIITAKRSMKIYSIRVTLLFTFGIISFCCKKDNPAQNPANAYSGKTVRFQLYTNQDFSDNAGVIHFSAFIKTGNVFLIDPTAGRFLYDSSFQSMAIKDIPDMAHKIIIEKKITGYDTSLLTAGFVYEIENVGYAWHIDTIKPENHLKVLDFNFQ